MGNKNSQEAKQERIESLAKDLVAVLPEKLLGCTPMEKNLDNPDCVIKDEQKKYFNVARLNIWIRTWKEGLCPIQGISLDGKHYIINGKSGNYEEYLFRKDKLVHLLTEVYGMNPVDTNGSEKRTIIRTKTFYPETAMAALEAQKDYQAATTSGVRSLQGVSQNEGAPNGLLGDFPTGTFEQISNAFGDEHTIGYGGSGATFLASLGAYEFLGLIGFLFFFALFVMKGIRACRKKETTEDN